MDHGGVARKLRNFRLQHSLGSLGPPALRNSHMESQGDLVSRLRTSITHVVILIIPILNLLTTSP